MFSDVVGSTGLRTKHGDAVAHGILRSDEEVIRACFSRHGGREVKSFGDGFMLAFTSVRRGVERAIAMQQAMADRNGIRPARRFTSRSA